jgi:hypothetical protein
MSKKKIVLLVAIFISLLLIFSGLFIFLKVQENKKMTKEMFRLNSQRRAEGYYMAEFEFKMVGILYHLDKGRYEKAINLFDGLHHQLKTGQGLVKVPEFADKQEELSFYLDRQNPKTGAFMDDHYPLPTYFGPTLNVILHMQRLAESLDQPLQLNYPLRFIEKMDSPKELRAYLDDLATVGMIVSKMPKTPNVLSMLLSYRDLENLDLYTFSPEWKNELLKWHWENQDPETGYWGVRLRSSGKLLKGGDLTTTPQLLKLFMDKKGNNLNEEFPLRYKAKIFETTIDKLKNPVPDDTAGQHEWTIDRERGIRILTVYLWDSLTTDQKEIAKTEMEKTIQIMFDKFYVPNQGAFSLYSGEDKADLDGTGEYLGLLRRLGALSSKTQQKLFGPADKTIINVGVVKTTQLDDKDFLGLKNREEINSIRLYYNNPASDELLSDAVIVTYPRQTPIPDIIELKLTLQKWLISTPQHMGNWVSKESIRQRLLSMKLKTSPVIKKEIPLDLINRKLGGNGELTLIGFDTLQIPRYKIQYRLVK